MLVLLGSFVEKLSYLLLHLAPKQFRNAPTLFSYIKTYFFESSDKIFKCLVYGYYKSVYSIRKLPKLTTCFVYVPAMQFFGVQNGLKNTIAYAAVTIDLCPVP
jgi:hypothetical protein